MKKIILLLSIVVLLSACAGMDYQYQQNMATNAVGWGLLGAGAGAAIASVTHGNVGQAATIGTVAGAALGATNTPPPTAAYSQMTYQPQPQYQPPAVYAPPPVVYAPPPPVVYYPSPIVYGGYGSPYSGLGGLNVFYSGGNYDHHGYNGGYYRPGNSGGGYRHGYGGGYGYRSNGGGYYRSGH